MRRSLRFLCMLAAYLPFTLTAQTISGAITSDTTWSGIVIADSVFIPAGRILTIQPGTTVKFNAGKSLVVAGRLDANGTAANPITFTSNASTPAAGNWNGIELQSSADVNSIINYCIIEYAGGGLRTTGLFYNTGAPAIKISNSTFRLNAGHGVNVRASNPRISTSTFRDNSGYGIFADLSLSLIVDSCIVSKNTTGGILIAQNSIATVTNCAVDSNGIGIFIGSSAAPTIQKNNIRRNNIGIQFTGVGGSQPTISQDTIVNNITWGFLNTSTSTTVLARQNYWGSDTGPFHASLNPTGLGDKVSDFVDFQPWTILAAALSVTTKNAGSITTSETWSSGVYWVKGDITVTSGNTLTISPGVIVKFAPGARLTISGSINANGTAANPIVFTSEKDDPYGGDSNGDGATVPTRGSWDMLWLNGGQNSTSVLNNCVFRFGGSTGYGNLRVDASSPTISNLSSTQSSYYGLFLYNNADPTILNSTFGSNTYDGMLIQQNSDPTIYGTTFLNNGRYGIHANSGSARFTVRKSKFNGNSYGIVADAGSGSATLVSLDSSDVSNNINGGLYLWYGTGAQTFSYNRIANNGTYGLWCFNVDNLVTIVGDTIVNNGNDGIVTSKASIMNNVIQGNRYPIALFGRLGSTYSGNTISGNQINNALALRINRYEESFSDTLNSTFPAGMTSGTYVMIENSPGYGVLSGKTLVIQPGIIIKMEQGLYLRVDGTLKADASGGSPIVFTSHRDNSYGGKTTLATDNAAPVPNDWRYIRLYGSGANGSVFNNVIFKYGGRDGYGNLFIDNNITLGTPIRNIISRRASSRGITVDQSVVTFESVTVDSNASQGIYISNSNPISDVTVRTSFIRYNGNEGLRAVNNSAFREVSNCFIEYNGGWGINIDNGTINQTFQGNTIRFNGAGGIANNSPSIPATGLQFIGNEVTDHPEDGILSSRARFIDNKLNRNRFPLSVWGNLGNIYVDNGGVDGNIITGNVYNNAISIYSGGISDTLRATFPQAITSKTYVALYDISVDASATLVIEPGVRMKFQMFPTNNWQSFNIYGTLIANGTPTNPIIFTSWRDSTVGGKTTAVNDYTPPAPGDWYYIAFRNGSGSSVIRNCQFKYGGRDGQQTVYFEQNLGGMIFSNNLVRRSSTNGIFIYNTAAVIDSTTVDSCAYSGIRVNAVAGNNLTLRNSKLLSNSQYGLWVQSPANLSILTNCDISRNGYSGVYVENNSVPLSVLNNTVNNNDDHGLYLISRNDLVDSLLMIAGNKIRNNGLAGLFSSRAYIVDDSITGNRYPIGLVGQFSLENTGTANGNVYQNTVITGNTYNQTMVTEGSIFGTIGASFPPAITSKTIAVRGDADVPSGTTLTVSPGTVIKFPREYGNGRLTVNGVLKSEGTSTTKIVFTSWEDDSYGGDTNADTSATVPAASDWDMVYLYGSQNNNSRIFNTIIRYGGRTGYGNLYLYSNNALIDSSISSFSSYYGIYLNSASPTITGCEIHHNPTGIRLIGSSNPVINQNNFYDNTNYGLDNSQGNTTAINATNNYWGASTGPYVNQGSDQNLAGTGNRIGINSGPVTYRPYLTSRSGILLGDVSGNGTISAFDGSLILQYLVSQINLTSPQKIAANVSGDTTVSALDASYILRYVVGLISGFPGLGKQSLETDIASAFAFNIEKGQNPNEFDLIIHLNKPTNVYGLNFKLSFDTTLVKPIGMKKTMQSDSMTMVHYFPSGYANVAMAGLQPLNTAGDVARFTFKLLDPAKAMQQVLFTVEKFVLNEMDVTKDVGSIILNVKDIAEIPTTFGLSQNYPNPFNPVTSIKYQIPATSRVRISIYNLLGQEVKTLVNEEQSAGFYAIKWNGTDNNNRSVASGVYIYRIDASAGEKNHFVQVKKMLMIK